MAERSRSLAGSAVGGRLGGIHEGEFIGMLQVSLDTSFLISFADPDRPNHAAAVSYFRHCLAERIPMWLSTVAAGEFEVRQPVSDLPLQNFRIQPYNLPHAIRAAALFRAMREEDTNAQEDPRRVVINDLKILA